MSKGPHITRDFGLARLIAADAQKNGSTPSPSLSPPPSKPPSLISAVGDDGAEIDEFAASISADLMFAQKKLPGFVTTSFSKKGSLKRISLELINSFLREKYPPLRLVAACAKDGMNSLVLLNTESCEVLDSISV